MENSHKRREDHEEHLAVLESARDALEQSHKNLKLGRERLDNAIKKYKERLADGPTKPI